MSYTITGLHIQDIIVARPVDKADLWWRGVVGEIMMVDWKLVVTGRGSGRATVDVLDAYRDVGGRCQCRYVDVVTLATHRLHLLHYMTLDNYL